MNMNMNIKYTVRLLTCAILLTMLSGCNSSSSTVSNIFNDTSQSAEVEHDLTNKEIEDYGTYGFIFNSYEPWRWRG